MTNPNRINTDRCARYRQLASQGVALMGQINRNPHPQDANCPETADAVNDFLNTGRVRAVRTVSAVGAFNFPPNLNWSTVNIQTLLSSLANCSHRVVRGLRNPSVTGVTREHYFVVFKVDNRVWVADAYSLELSNSFQAYVNAEPPPQRMLTFQVPTGAAYDIIPNDPLSGF